MNKKLKFMSSVLCGVLIASHLGAVNVYAKTNSVNTSDKEKQEVIYDVQLNPSNNEFMIINMSKEEKKSFTRRS